MVILQQLQQGIKPAQISFTQGAIYTNLIHSKGLISKSISKAEAREVAAKKHSEAERRRRILINRQYAALRTILPNLVKIDKASILGEAIKTVRELRKTMKELKSVYQVHEECLFPNERNELNLRFCNVDGRLLQATLNSEDKPGLLSELTSVLRSVKGRAVRAETVTIGGRTKCVLWVEGLRGKVEMVTLKRALSLVIDRPVLLGKSDKLSFY